MPYANFENHQNLCIYDLMVISQKVIPINGIYLLGLAKKIKRQIVNFEVEQSTCEKLSEAHFDNRLTFDYHISKIRKKVSKKTNAQAGVC